MNLHAMNVAEHGLRRRGELIALSTVLDAKKLLLQSQVQILSFIAPTLTKERL